MNQKGNRKIISYLPETDEHDWRDIKDAVVCKFVNINYRENCLLVLGLLNVYPYHALLVERFCHDFGISSGWGKKPDLYEIYEKGYFIRGGWVEIDNLTSTIKFYGYSTAYGKYDPEHISNILNSTELFNHYQLIIDN